MKVISYFFCFFLLNFFAVSFPQIQFFPPVDTAYIFGGCTAPEIICHNLISTPVRDSILIEPGFNTSFYYYDSLGNPVSVDNFYFIITDPLDQLEYELWFYPKSYPPFDPVLILFDSTFYFYQNDFDIRLIVKQNDINNDSLTQHFHADYGLGVENDNTQPQGFILSQNYPNPFNPNTNVEFRIADFGFVAIKVFDVLGREIVTLVNEQKPAGDYKVELDGSNLPSGIYFYQLKAGNYIETKKMILLK